MRRVLVVAIVLAASPASAGRGFGLLVPPAEVDVGAFSPAGDGQALAGPTAEVLAGMHWASLYWKPTRLDFGVGYVGSFRPIDPSFRTTENIALRSSGAGGSVDEELRLHGMYIQMGATFVKDRHYRAWLAWRGELMKSYGMPRDFSVAGSALRIAAEMYASGHAGEAKGNGIALIAGTVALGAYVEASYRDLPSEYGPYGVIAGFSVRVPFMIVAVN
jgi:hypothetical protein